MSDRGQRAWLRPPDDDGAELRGPGLHREVTRRGTRDRSLHVDGGGGVPTPQDK